MAKKTATIQEVARYCGVSTATVSRIVNNTDYPVSDEVRRKVQKAVETLQYRPNALGRFLKHNTTNDIGVIVSDIRDSYCLSLVGAIHDAFINTGYNVLLSISYRNPSYERQLFESLVQKRVRAIIFFPSTPNYEWLQEEKAEDVSLIVIGGKADKKTDQVYSDHYAGGRLAADFLLELGHRRFAVVSINLSSAAQRRQVRGFQDRLKEEGVETPPSNLYVSDYQRVKDRADQFGRGIFLAEKLLRQKTPPTAIFCLNDTLALGVIQALHSHGIRIPEDMSVLGYGNEETSGMVVPSLSTLDSGAHMVGMKAAEILMKRFQDANAAAEAVCVKPQLVKRRSTAALRT